MQTDYTIRPATEADLTPAYAVFRRGICAYLASLGAMDPSIAEDPPIASAWRRQGRWITHLWTTSHANWVACDGEGRVVGWAMSALRGRHLELTFFFVDPGVQSRGLGRTLLDRAFAPEPGMKRTIMATQSPRALSLYLRTGIAPVGTSMDFLARVWEPVPANGDLTFERLAADDDAVAAIGQIDAAVLGFRRDVDIRFLQTSRPAWLARRGGAPAGYVFGIQPNPPDSNDYHPVCGPMAALDPADMPALIDQVMAEPGGAETFSVTLPFANRTGITHLLERGAQIGPFYVMLLADDVGLKVDRYVHTSPTFIL